MSVCASFGCEAVPQTRKVCLQDRKWISIAPIVYLRSYGTSLTRALKRTKTGAYTYSPWLCRTEHYVHVQPDSNSSLKSFACWACFYWSHCFFVLFNAFLLVIKCCWCIWAAQYLCCSCNLWMNRGTSFWSDFFLFHRWYFKMPLTTELCLKLKGSFSIHFFLLLFPFYSIFTTFSSFKFFSHKINDSLITIAKVGLSTTRVRGQGEVYCRPRIVQLIARVCK